MSSYTFLQFYMRFFLYKYSYFYMPISMTFRNFTSICMKFHIFTSYQYKIPGFFTPIYMMSTIFLHTYLYEVHLPFLHVFLLYIIIGTWLFIKFSKCNVASHRGTRPVPPCSPSGLRINHAKIHFHLLDARS